MTRRSTTKPNTPPMMGIREEDPVININNKTMEDLYVCISQPQI